tara:strand:- start:103 stop:315 length:213 start_codon:yes stop_codon:yes gene_type:complete
MTNKEKHREFKNKIEIKFYAYGEVLKDIIKSRDNNKIEDLNDFYDGQVEKYQGKIDTLQELTNYYDELFK